MIFRWIRPGRVLTPLKSIAGGSLLCRGGRIIGVGTETEIERIIRGRHDRAARFELEILDFPGLTAVPGFVDIHVHGGGGADFMDADPRAARTVLETHLKQGTTSIVPTLMTASAEDILKSISVVRECQEESGPEILGLHLEGPYIAAEKRGAQPAEHIRRFSTAEMSRFIKASGNTIKIVTLAPELEGAARFVRFLGGRGIIASAGHSAATIEQAEAAIRTGIRHGTHLFNAMTGLFHRDPGLAGALLLDDRVSVELIADGIHLHPAILRLVARLKPPEKIILVTDATRPAGLSGAPLRTEDGRLYGSTITLADAVRNMSRLAGLPLERVLPMATLNPARRIGAQAKGRLAPGADADIVLLDRSLRVRGVFANGVRVR
jgi:N-acetylglucosamine-6-phosphate deacetylase